MRRSNSSGAPVSSACTGASKPSARGRLRHVVHLAVGDHDDAGEAVGRRVGERRVEVGEQVGAGRCRRRARPPVTHLTCEARDLAELGLEVGLDRARLLGPVAERLAGALVDDDDGDVGEALALLLAQRRIGERGEQARRARSARSSAPRVRRNSSSATSTERQARPRRPEQRARAPSARSRSTSSCHAASLTPTARAARAAPARAPGRPCSCRSAHT